MAKDRSSRLQGRLALAFGGALLLYALWPWLPVPGRAATPRTVVFYGFSILGEAMNEDVLPAFARSWRRATGERVEFVTAFAGSGTVTNQLILGVPAQCALLSLELDAERLAAAGVVPPGSWRRFPHGGVVNRTPFVIVVRKGNPKRIHDFADLARPGVRVVHPDPLTSGGANWAILAEYGAAARRAPSRAREAGFQALLGVWHNVSAQAASARAARTQFENGFGDALVTYEQDVIEDAAEGTLPGAIIYPASTVLSEHTLVVIDKNIAPAERPVIDALVKFLWSDEAQRLFVKRGFRSVDERLNAGNPAFGTIRDPFLVADFGGWQRVKREIVDGIWKDRVMREVGK
ncbi:MAG TPA: substrate-binding domain-containing protein [Thermoanaerobaculia bacterium]|jgi:sulfate transport system substrate-binding protein|nr:substrate-binding domain-containing protein [Thermoanaerobaculia bacterium]